MVEREPIPARHQLGQRTRSGISFAFLALDMAPGWRENAGGFSAPLFSRALPARIASRIQPLDLLFTEYASAGRGCRAARIGSAVSSIPSCRSLANSRRRYRL